VAGESAMGLHDESNAPSSLNHGLVNHFLAAARPVCLLIACGVAAALAEDVRWRGVNGLDLFWQGAVALLPLILLVAPQLWRRICPFAVLNVAAAQWRRRGIVPWLPRQATLWVKRYGVVLAAALFWSIVPMRLFLFNRGGQATATLILVLAIAALALGVAGPWKASWCCSICPVYPVEKFYGAAPVWSMPDARCIPRGFMLNCYRCALHCLDVPETEDRYWKAMEKAGQKPAAERVRRFFVGSFPGFVLAYWILARMKGVGPFRVLLVYLTFLLSMAGSYACYRAAQSRFESRRVELVTIAVAFDVYYVGASAGLAALVSQIAGWSAGLALVHAGIVTLTFLIGVAWLHRAWRLAPAPWTRW
jgi:nitrite reductase (NADH) large subunit